MFKLVKHDLEFILKQIKIAENHVKSGYVSYADAQGNPIGGLVPYGLRTVSGEYNNLTNVTYGSADELFPRLLTPHFQSADINPRTGAPTSYQQTSGSVYDADPRIISNLVVDQSVNNDAAIYAALTAIGDADPYASGDKIIAVRDANYATPQAKQAAIQTELARYNLTLESGTTLLIPNVMADLGDTAPFNSFTTLFAQFFTHGLDLVTKGGSGTVFIPLQPDDPLYVAGSPTNFMVLTRATNAPGADGVLGTADDVHDNTNQTSPFIDLSQVYTSHESHQVFLREYTLVNGKPVATGRMLEGQNGGPPTWADIKLQAAQKLGISLSDFDVHRVPLLATDKYGNFIPGVKGFAQLVVPANAGAPGTPVAMKLVEGSPSAPVAASGAMAAGHAFLDDIANSATPGLVDHDRNPATAPVPTTPDADNVAGNSIAVNQFGVATSYDNELLDKHFIVGDGRGNENIGLTAVHHVFHSEHNTRVEQIKSALLASGDVKFLNEWLSVPVATMPAPSAINSLVWNGERVFQAARVSTEMVYQHLVFEEFARLVAPAVDPFVFSNNVNINPAITAEFAHVVFRFGHSMLDEKIDRLAADGQTSSDIGLIQGFLNPIEFGSNSDVAAGAIIRGMTRQVGNEIDEFVTGALRNNLLGLPLDLATLNIARGRDTGMPSLNEARSQFFEMTGNDTRLKPYANWVEFTQNLKHPASAINFIAAYGEHPSIVAATTVDAKRDAAMKIVFGGPGAPADSQDFLNARGAYTGGSLGGLNKVDFWIGGLAEAKMAFGGMLGSTFNFVFETQMEQLQAGDRFYYLSRTQGLNLLNQLEADSFAELVMRNTDLGDPNATHLPSSLFLTPDYILELDQMRQKVADPVQSNKILQSLTPLVVRKDTDGDGKADALSFNGDAHVVLGGNNANNTLQGGKGDDTLWGDGGNDRLDGGLGVDHVFGGDGDDIITDVGNDIGAGDVLHGDAGNDVINGGSGLDLIFGGEGQDFIFGGTEAKDITAGLGNDFVSGPVDGSVLKGNEGDDWIEGGTGAGGLDVLAGENSELFFNSTIIGHDVLNGRDGDNDYDAESGDDIMVQGAGIERNNGMAGFDWGIHKGATTGVQADLGIPLFVNQQANILRDRFDLVEGLSGSNFDDLLVGREAVIGAYDAVTAAAAQFDPATTPFQSYANALTQQGVARISGLSEILGQLGRASFTVAGQQESVVVFDQAAVVRDAQGNAVTMYDTAADILLGGGGSDVLQGKGGNDIIDGDRELNVRIAINNPAGQMVAWANEMGGQVYNASTNAVMYNGDTLANLMFNRTLNPGQLSIVREVIDGDVANKGVDVAVYSDRKNNYTFKKNADGSVTVDHVDGTRNDGVDQLYNIERLRFTDGEFSLEALINNAPVFVTGPNLSINENSTRVADIDATDVDPGQTLTYSLAGGADAARFAIDPETGVLSFLNAPNFEAPTDVGANNVYDVVVRVSDGIEATDRAFNVTVNNVNEAATGSLNISSYTFNTLLGVETSANLTATNTLNDPDGMTNLRYQWQSQGVNGVWNNIAGANALTLNNQSGTTVRLSASYNDAFGANTVVSVENGVVGTSLANTVNGTAANEWILGLAGNDTLSGGAGNDRVDGGSGNDVLRASVNDGNDVYIGGVGTDTYDWSLTTAAATVDLNAGTASSAQTGTDTLTGIENLIAGSGNDLVRDATGSNNIQLGAGNDTMSFMVDNTRDIISGGGGTDTADYSAFTTGLTVNLGNSVAVSLVTGSGSVDANADTLTGFENFTGGSGNDVIVGSGVNAIVNILNGGAGNDRITGGFGVDQLIGGAGSDVFIYTSTDDLGAVFALNNSTALATQAERIQDFTQGQDRIDLSAIDARVGTTGNQAFNFLGTAAFTTANTNGGLRYSYLADQNITVVEGSVDADPALDTEFQIVLSGRVNLTANDFVL